MGIHATDFSGGPKPTLAALVLSLAFISPAAHAETDSDRDEARTPVALQGFFYGGAVGIRREIYDGYDQRVVPIPVIGYQGDRLRIFGPFVTYDLARAGGLSLDARLAPRFQGYDESDSDLFRGMDDRDSSFDAGFGLKYRRGEWKWELAGLRDLLDRSGGREWSADLGRTFRFGPLGVEPAIGVQYLDRKHVDYYYGVAPAEAASFRSAYDGDSALNTRFGVALVTPAWFGGLTRIGIERTWFDSSISDSPLTDADANLGIFIAFSKFFDH